MNIKHIKLWMNLICARNNKQQYSSESSGSTLSYPPAKRGHRERLVSPCGLLGWHTVTRNSRTKNDQTILPASKWSKNFYTFYKTIYFTLWQEWEQKISSASHSTRIARTQTHASQEQESKVMVSFCDSALFGCFRFRSGLRERGVRVGRWFLDFFSWASFVRLFCAQKDGLFTF